MSREELFSRFRRALLIFYLPIMALALLPAIATLIYDLVTR